MPARRKLQQLRAVDGHSADEEQRIRPPAKLQVEGITQLASPPSRLKQQMLPVEQAPPLTQFRLAPPQVAWGSMHLAPPAWMQQDCVPGVQVVWPQGIG